MKRDKVWPNQQTAQTTAQVMHITLPPNAPRN